MYRLYGIRNGQRIAFAAFKTLLEAREKRVEMERLDCVRRIEIVYSDDTSSDAFSASTAFDRKSTLPSCLGIKSHIKM